MAKVLWVVLFASLLIAAVESHKKREKKKKLEERLDMELMKKAAKRLISGHFFSKTRLSGGHAPNHHQMIDFLKRLNFNEQTSNIKHTRHHGLKDKKLLHHLKALTSNADDAKRFFKEMRKAFNDKHKNLKRKYKKAFRKMHDNKKRHFRQRPQHTKAKSKLNVIHADNELGLPKGKMLKPIMQ